MFEDFLDFVDTDLSYQDWLELHNKEEKKKLEQELIRVGKIATLDLLINAARSYGWHGEITEADIDALYKRLLIGQVMSEATRLPYRGWKPFDADLHNKRY